MSNQKYHTIGAIVDQFLIDNNLTEHFFQKALSWALWGLTDLHLNTFQDVKTCLLDVTDRKTAALPANYVQWTKVGVKRGQYVVTLAVNDALAKTQRTDEDEHIRGLLYQNLPNGLNLNNYSGYYFFNHDGDTFFGIGGGLPDKRSFQVVRRDACYELLLDYDFPCEQVYVEYITDGFDPCKETVINPVMRDYILKYIDYKYEEKNNPDRTEASIARKGRDLYHAEAKVRANVNTIDKATLLATSRSGTRLTAKI